LITQRSHGPTRRRTRNARQARDSAVGARVMLSLLSRARVVGDIRRVSALRPGALQVRSAQRPEPCSRNKQDRGSLLAVPDRPPRIRQKAGRPGRRPRRQIGRRRGGPRCWRIRGLIHRVRRALPSCSRRHLSLRAHAWLLLSVGSSLATAGETAARSRMEPSVNRAAGCRCSVVRSINVTGGPVGFRNPWKRSGLADGNARTAAYAHSRQR